jgi:GNAT superfamily N-acetyltransferase
MDVQIMFANLFDVKEWMAIVDTVEDYFPGLDKEGYRKTLVGCIEKKEAICAKMRGKIAGILLFSVEQSVLAFMAVHPEYRKCGIAGNMIKAIIPAFPKGRDIWVTTYREGDPKGEVARALYLRCGFEPDELVVEMDYPCQKFVLRREE